MALNVKCEVIGYPSSRDDNCPYTISPEIDTVVVRQPINLPQGWALMYRFQGNVMSHSCWGWTLSIYTNVNPSCLQTTAALTSFQSSSHTLPHWPLRKTSTLPSFLLSPATKRTRGPANKHVKKKCVIELLVSYAIRYSDVSKYWHIRRYAGLYKENKQKPHKLETQLFAWLPK